MLSSPKNSPFKIWAKTEVILFGSNGIPVDSGDGIKQKRCGFQTPIISYGGLFHQLRINFNADLADRVDNGSQK